MNTIFSERFKSARLLNGLSLQALADAIGGKVSRQALHRYEKGEVIPDSEMIKLLSEVLNVRPDFFFRDTKVEIGKVEFRKLKNLPVKEQHKIIEQTKEHLSRYLELEEIIGISSAFESPLSKLKNITEYKQVNEAANKVREAWKLGLDPVYNITELLEDNHIKVIKLDADASFDGLQTWVNGNIPVIAFNSRNVMQSDRIRFTLLHELGHLLLDNAFGNITEPQKEKLCHQFAGAMLLPEKTLKDELGNHRNRLYVQELGHIKKQYGISMQAIVMRALVCGIVTDHYVRQFFSMIKLMGWKKVEPITYEGIEESNRFDQLLFRALAEEQISVSKAASLKNKKLAEFKSENLMV